MSARAQAPAGGAADPRAESRAWWAAHRGRYNRVLVISGIAAAVAYHAAMPLLCDPETLGTDVELSVMTLVGQAILFVFFLAVANICYELGAPAERMARPRDPGRFRRRLYLLGLVILLAVPWLVPVSAAVECVNAPRVPPPQALAPAGSDATLIVRMG